jgi:hypothetical protein
MALSFFCDKNKMPKEEQVTDVLGRAAIYWDGVKQYIGEYGAMKQEWKIYSQKAGWCKKLFLITEKDERNIIFLYPNEECLTCVLVYGEKAVEAVNISDLPKDIISNILLAKAYKEGRSFNVEIKTFQDFEILKKLIYIKINN